MKVLSLGGSLIVPESIDTEYLIQFKEFVLRHVDQGEKFVIICGGGKVCRNYYAALNIITLSSFAFCLVMQRIPLSSRIIQRRLRLKAF
ncbi:hypothetical protein J4464_00205 [Candidatus Woesearchaeota archaeon]|nr:hypothetical protein [Candidatus Woesearchaeota archaeon]